MTAPNQIFDFNYFNSLHSELEKCGNESEVVRLLEQKYSEFEYEQKALPWLKLMLHYFEYEVTDPIIGFELKAGYKNRIVNALLDWEVTAQRLEERKNNTIQPAAINCRLSNQDIKRIFPLLKKGKYIETSTTEAQFIAALGPDVLPESRVKWTGSRKDCFSFMLFAFGEEIKPAEINKHFAQFALNTKTNLRNMKPLVSGDKTHCKGWDLK